MMQPDSSTLAWLIAVPVLGALAVAAIARMLRRRWVPDADAVTTGTLAAVLVMAAFLTAFHLIALGRMLELLSGLSVGGITALFVLFLEIALVLMIRYSPAAPVSRRALSRWGGPSRADWLCLVPVVGAHLLLMVEALSRTPTGHDALKYHLPLAVMWIRTDALIVRPDIWMFALPGNGHLPMWWLLKSGVEHLASLAYWPAGVLLAGAVWSIVRTQRGSRFAGILAVAIVLSTHLVVWQMYAGYIDLFGTAFLAAGIASFLLAVSEKERTRPARRLLVVIAGLAIGIALGTKPVNWGYGLAVAVFFFVVHLYRNRRQLDLVFLLPVFCLACLACSMFWFLRAAVETGNPFCPIQVTVGDHVLLKGFDIGWTGQDPPLYMLASLGGIIELLRRLPGFAATVDVKVGGVGPLFSMFVPPGMLIAVAGVTLRGRRAMRHDRLVVLLLTGILFAVWVLAIRHYGRFGIIYLVMATCLAAPVVGWVARFWPRVIYGAALVATCLACATVTIVPCDSLCRRILANDLSRAHYYHIPKLIDGFPAGTRIANLTSPKLIGARGLTYPLYGKGLKNDVIDFMTIEALFPDLRPTVEQLQELDVEYVFLREPITDDWTDGTRLELIYQDREDPNRPPTTPASRIYRVPAPDTEARHAVAMTRTPGSSHR